MGRRLRMRCEELEDRTTPATLEPGFTEGVYLSASGLAGATGLAWVPDGSNRLYVARKSGDVRVVRNGALVATAFSTDTVFTNSECGLIGMTFDRDYVTNGYVYLFITLNSSTQQIIRYTDANKDDIADAGSRTIIMNNLPTAGNNHDGGGIGIGFDNKLYWGIGDLGNGTGVDLDLTTLAAKIGRANLDGSIPNDNPHNDGAGTNNDYIYARGFRNPFTLTFQETTGELWVNVVGTTYEQTFRVNAGDHAGYNDFEGNQPTAGSGINYIRPEIVYRTSGTNDARTLTNATRNGNIITFTHNVVAGGIAMLQPGSKITVTGVADSSFNGTFDILAVNSVSQFTVAQTGSNASSTGGTATLVDLTLTDGGAASSSAMTGGTFLNTTAVPAQYRGDFYFTDYVVGDVFRASINGSEVTAINKFITQFANGFSTVVDAAVGPDGSVYYVSAGGSSQVMRSAYTLTSQDIIVTPQYLAFPEGGKTGFSVRLATAPAANVTVNVTQQSGDVDMTVFSGGTLTFTPSNWSTPQAVVVAAATDADTANDTAVFAISSAGLTTQTLGYTAIDAGGQSLVLSTTAVTINEGSTATFTVRLQTAPSGNVTVNVARTGGDTDVTVQSGSTLTFTPSNWSTPQTVTLAAAEDADFFNDPASITVSAIGALNRTVAVTVNDNDDAPPSITSTADTTNVAGALYTYDVNATGSPPPTYALSTFPAGMTINTTTGVISWTPASTGIFNVTVQAANGVGTPATQSFAITVSSDTAPTAVITNPTNGATISGSTAEFYGDGIDDVNTVRGEFRIDGVLVYTDTTPGNHYHINGSHNLFDTTLLTNGPHTLRLTVVDTAGMSGFAEVNVTVNNPLGVRSLRVNDTINPTLPNTTQSRLTSLVVNFNDPVTAAPGAFSISGFDLAGAPQTLTAIAVANNGTNSLRLTFPSLPGGSLADGRWRLNIENTLLTGPAGILAADYQSVEFRRLFGDINGDSTVDGPSDFTTFAFRTAANDPFDFNGDGTIDGPTDFAEFGLRFGKTL